MSFPKDLQLDDLLRVLWDQPHATTREVFDQLEKYKDADQRLVLAMDITREAYQWGARDASALLGVPA